MKKIIFCLISAIFISSAFAQTESKQADKKIVFGKEFVMKIDKGENNTIYLVDMTKLNSKFERMYFMELIYKDSKIISMDSDINKDQVRFAANNKYTFPEIQKLFLDLKVKTEQAAINSSSRDKNKVLNQNKVK